MKFLSLFSRSVGQIILGVSGLLYANKLWGSPFENVITVGLSAFGAIAALSALCFTMAPCLTSENENFPVLYAGEKFFHSSILLIQTIFIKFAGDSILNMQMIVNIPWLQSLIHFVTSIAASLTGAVATWFAIYGFESINDLFWQRFEKQRSDLQKSKKSK